MLSCVAIKHPFSHKLNHKLFLTE